MKKTYIIPQMEVIGLRLTIFLCSSGITGDLGGIADEPGKSRLFDDWDEEWSE
ncbi:MAG: hypothetical protein J6T44_09210 [Prevotella sp.]|nr:hypothetical protein [Prevotella sp.]MBO7539444.1 hypothetical protein [Prevotella sp.]